MRKVMIFIALTLFWVSGAVAQVEVSGELKKWHKVTLTFDGPSSSETANPNPFLDYRLQVTFTNGNTKYNVPGYFAADGRASESGATSGNKWRVHFTPDVIGTWSWEASFRQGNEVAVSEDPVAGFPTSFHGLSGTITVANSDKSGRDHRAKGRLQYVGERYLRFVESGQYFIKVGADSPENFLAYEGFDNTPDNGGYRKSWEPHLADWNAGDPLWKGNLGRPIIGALNYLAEQGQNAFSFLTLSVRGDDKNVFPFISESSSDRVRMDCSKLDQWEIVFEHADQQGLFLHFKTQESENDQLLDNGDLFTQRRLYYRELVARFGHHLALNWSLGEENTNTDCQRFDFADYFKFLDPYDHPIVLHSFYDQDDLVFGPLVDAFTPLAGASLQSPWANVYDQTLEWITKAEQAEKAWVVTNDEQGPVGAGVPDDNETNTDQTQENIRKKVLWGNLMAGGAGVEYYFGTESPDSDLRTQDYRSRANMWKYNRIAETFFRTYLPFWEMENHDELLNGTGEGHCFADPGKIYVVYLEEGGNWQLDLGGSSEEFMVEWYNPREGGTLLQGESLSGGGVQNLGLPPSTGEDWVALIQAGEFDFDPSALNLLNPGNQQNIVGDEVFLSMRVSGGTVPFFFGALDLPPGLRIDVSTGIVSGILEGGPDPEEPTDYRILSWVVDNSNPLQVDSVVYRWRVSPRLPCPPAGTACNDGDLQTVNDVQDGDCNCVGQLADINDVRVWQEVECGTVGRNWKEAFDGTASNQSYVTTVKTSYSVDQPPTLTDDLIQIPLQVPFAGWYRFFARTITTNNANDSFWFRFNGGPWIKWNSINQEQFANDFQWDIARGQTWQGEVDVELFELEAGSNLLEIAWREPGIQLDKVLVSPQIDLPNGTGVEFDGCASVVTNVREQPNPVNVQVNPSPAVDYFTVEGNWPSNAGGSVRDQVAVLYDGYGREVDTRVIPGGFTFRMDWEVSNLPTGMYWLQLGQYRKKILVSR